MRAALLAAVTLAPASSPLAARAAEPCASLDLTCLDDPLLARVEEGVDDVIDPVDETADPVEEELDPVVEPIRDVVDDVLGSGDIVDPPGGGAEDPEPGPGDDRRGGKPAAGPERPIRSVRDPPIFVQGSSPATTIEISADSGTRSDRPGGFGGIIEDAVRGALLLLILFGITIGFVVLQDRLDRGDPKLAIAPTRADVVRFE